MKSKDAVFNKLNYVSRSKNEINSELNEEKAVMAQNIRLFVCHVSC
jgi:hypothetical protein